MACEACYHNDGLLDVARLQAGIAQGRLAGVDGPLNEGVDRGLELGTEEFEVDVFGARTVHANERRVDLDLSDRRKLDPWPSQRPREHAGRPWHRWRRSTPVSFLNSSRMRLTRVLTTEMGVPVGGLGFEGAALGF